MTLASKLKEFANLQKGWCYGRGGPISEEVLDKTREIIDLLRDKGYNVDIFPGEDCGVLVGGHKGDYNNIDVRVNPCKTLDVVIEKSSSEEEISVDSWDISILNEILKG